MQRFASPVLGAPFFLGQDEDMPGVLRMPGGTTQDPYATSWERWVDKLRPFPLISVPGYSGRYLVRRDAPLTYFYDAKESRQAAFTWPKNLLPRTVRSTLKSLPPRE